MGYIPWIPVVPGHVSNSFMACADAFFKILGFLVCVDCLVFMELFCCLRCHGAHGFFGFPEIVGTDEFQHVKAI